ncbi:MAG: RidA family protein [Psychrilyobacter sp.]|uniref:RidA family protein n=1 Tax=Psychrilyobacter sp. TaxID=2586924 RepID=UPI003C76AD7C
MNIKRYNTQKRMSHAVIHNNVAYLCGQIPKDETKGMAEQTKTTLEKVDQLLADIGSHKSKILSATVYIKDMNQFKEMNEMWDNWVEEGNTPARACVEANMARESLLVEVSVIAAI